jgi:hypothetical protein
MGRSGAIKQPPPPVSRTPAPAALTARSRVTNGKRLFVEVRDISSPWARRLRDLIALHVSDLGGADNCSEAEKMLVRRAAMLTLQMELLEQRWAEKNDGEASEKSLIVYQRCVGSLRRVLRDLGLRRRPRDVTPDPLDYARHYAPHHEGEPA